MRCGVRWKGEPGMEKNNFKLSAEILQKNATKSSVRDLNAEFQRMGGKVIYKASPKGDTYQLSHPDEVYLEEFRVRLFRELGLIEEKKVPESAKDKKAPPPRYGDKYTLRRGWNVRSPKEFSEGKFNKEDVTPPEEPAPEPRSSEDWRPEPKTDAELGEEKEGPEEDEGKSFEERWGNVDDFMVLIKAALKEGAVDDGEIIKFAYRQEMPEEKIKKLKKLLWDNRCRGPRANCPHGKKKFRFEDLMKVVSGKVEGWENIDSPFIKLVDDWRGNMDRMYGAFKDRDVEVEGKISSYKPVYRKGHEHLKMLVYDTNIKDLGGKGKGKPTRKVWVKITLKEFRDLNKDKKVHIEDIVRFRGRCIYDQYFHDYWIIDLRSLDVLKEGGGEVISPPPP